MVPPFLNGCAVSVPRHALAMAHAIKGGKCKVWEKWPTGQPQAGGSEHLELHGAFSIALRAPGAALLSRLGFLAGRGAREIAFWVGVAGRNETVTKLYARTHLIARATSELPRTRGYSIYAMLLARRGFASSRSLWQDQRLSETQLTGLLQSWLDAFNADNPTSYRAFITKYLPDGLPYIDDDLAVRVLHRKYFRIAGMYSTSQLPSSGDKSAIPYTGALATGLKPVPPYYGTPAGGGYSTVDDFFAFARAIQSNRLLDPKHTAMLTTGKVDTGNGSYSLGLAVSSRNGVPCYGHGGSAPGVNGDFTIYPQQGYITAVLCNRATRSRSMPQAISVPDSPPDTPLAEGRPSC
jgi:hypothetical protein